MIFDAFLGKSNTFTLRATHIPSDVPCLQPSSATVKLSQVATPTLPTLRSDVLRAQELVRLTGKAVKCCEDLHFFLAGQTAGPDNMNHLTNVVKKG